jgi:DNA repair exonuclease SbcCD ATPase subunit
MISGRQGLDSIEAALRQVESEEAEARRQAERETGQRAESEKSLNDGYRELARVRIDISLEDGVIDRADGLTSDVMEHLARWQAAHRAAEAKWDALKGEIDDWRRKRHQAHDKVEKARAIYDAAYAEARERLSTEPGHAALMTAQADALAHIQNARTKAEKAEAERAEKDKPYAADPLFMYLWKRSYGTPRYAGGGITRLLDGWVARLIGYSEARINYAALTEIPVRLNQYVARLEETARKADEAIHASLLREVAVIAQEDIAGRIAALEAELAALEEGVTKREAAFDALSDEVTRLAQGHDPHLEAAVESLASILSSTSFRQLAAEARNTPSLKDDQLLERIQNTASMMAQIEDRVAEHRKRLDQLAARRSDLLRIAAEFRRQRYDDNSSVFTKDEVFSGLLRQLLAGLITAGQYWAEIQRHQTRQRRASDRFPRYDDVILGGGRSWPRGSGGGSWGGGGISFPSGGGGSWGGGGGSSGGGGFRTGGSF